MEITIKEKDYRFGCRVGIVIFNDQNDKILMENQGDFYRIPGGRINYLEDSVSAAKRELEEELNINLNIKLKYTLEMVTNVKGKKYHEIGFYYTSKVSEEKIKNDKKSLDYDSYFEWIAVEELKKYKIIEKPIINEIEKYEDNDTVKHIIYKEK